MADHRRHLPLDPSASGMAASAGRRTAALSRTGAMAPRSIPRRYEETIVGDGTTTQFVIAHHFGAVLLNLVAARATPPRMRLRDDEVQVEFVDENIARLIFSVAPGNGERFLVLVHR